MSLRTNWTTQVGTISSDPTAAQTNLARLALRGNAAEVPPTHHPPAAATVRPPRRSITNIPLCRVRHLPMRINVANRAQQAEFKLAKGCSPGNPKACLWFAVCGIILATAHRPLSHANVKTGITNSPTPIQRWSKYSAMLVEKWQLANSLPFGGKL